MIVAESIGSRPHGIAPYYSLVIRDPYTVGRLPTNDIVFDVPDVSRQHATITILKKSIAAEHCIPLSDGSALIAPMSPPQHRGGGAHPGGFEHDPLVAIITSYAKNGTTVDDRVVTSSCIALDGSTIAFGSAIKFKLSFRPLVVSITKDFSEEYVMELADMLNNLGATVVENGPIPVTGGCKPIGYLHCADEISDDSWSLLALALGYSIVLPTYPFELLAALSENSSSPLHNLPKQCSFNTSAKASVFGSEMYRRPEPETVPFSLFGVNSSATLNRSRKQLFGNRVFLFSSDLIARRNGPSVAVCGGTCMFDPAHAHKHTSNHSKYVVIDEQVEAAADPLSLLSGDVRELLSEPGGGWVALPEQVIHIALLTNTFVPKPFPIHVPSVDDEGETTTGTMNDSLNSGRPKYGHDTDEQVYDEIISQKIEKNRGKNSGIAVKQQDRRSPQRNRHLQPTVNEWGTPGPLSPIAVRPHEEAPNEDDHGAESSDRTPSALAENDTNDDNEEMLNTNFSSPLPPVERGLAFGGQSRSPDRTARFVVLFEKTKMSMQQLILPELPRLNNVLRAASKNNYVSNVTVVYLERMLSHCIAQCTAINDLAQSVEAVTHMQQLQELAEICRASHSKALQALSFRSGGLNTAAHRIPSFTADPFALSPLSQHKSTAQRPAGGTTASSSGYHDPLGHNPPARAGAAREGLGILRYPAVPLDASRLRMKTRPLSGDAMLQSELRSPVAPSELQLVTKRRLLFIKKHGVDEGERRFATWMSAQPVEWIDEFYRGVEKKDITLNQLLRDENVFKQH